MNAGFNEHRFDSLKAAVSNKVGVEDREAGDLAQKVLNYFGYDEDIIDNLLDQEDRRLFYFLQDLGILKTAWEEAVLPTGRTWRIFYWFLNTDNIEHFAEQVTIVTQPLGIYESLPDGAWSRQEA